mmetsp:Transcript_7273/g.10203  ORF Transcript_7273/g.10203 Transcript_7273/m.10203 type:complete len:173 (+) Transcript_7273:102-620(+)
MATKHQRIGDAAWAKVSKVNAEFFALTYGSLVMQLIDDYEDVKAVNNQLDTIGTGACLNFKDTAETIAKIAFKMFLGITCDVLNWNTEQTSFSLILQDNPLIEFVDLPQNYKDLNYSNVLCGVIRGALEMVQMKVETKFIKDLLKGDDTNEIRVELKEIMADKMDDQYFENA